MGTWLFVGIVLAFGLALTMFVDKMKSRRGSAKGEPSRLERSKWLHYWFLGRFPTPTEVDKEEDDLRK